MPLAPAPAKLHLLRTCVRILKRCLRPTDAALRLRNLLLSCGYGGARAIDCGGVGLRGSLRLIVDLLGDFILGNQRPVPRRILLRSRVIGFRLCKLRPRGIELFLRGGDAGFGRFKSASDDDTWVVVPIVSTGTFRFMA